MLLRLGALLRSFFARRAKTIRDADFGRLTLSARPYEGPVWRNECCRLSDGVSVRLSIDSDGGPLTKRQRETFVRLQAVQPPALAAWLDERRDEAVAASARGEVDESALPWTSADEMLSALRLVELHLFADGHVSADAWLGFLIGDPTLAVESEHPLLSVEWRDAGVVHVAVE